ncbi:MAG: allantoate amidohydrolase [Edaphobacter sp.]|uniref:allantoate amidohydrolase n=1 Tax=Edaphobacter sp. TaxID=1934404 RepID=UPI00238D9C4A|nr:allantoate amidohydrolase [Edaphobacter sp.]MDE1177951.1 allantoate amidohydrolase [Edaphobacter sp.]
MDILRQPSGAKTEPDEILLHTAARAVDRCRELAAITDVAGETTRTFLSPAMRVAMVRVQSLMEAAGCSVTIDAAGNLRGLYAGMSDDAPRLLIGSHLDTVPNAGAFDGVLGVMIGLALVEMLQGQKLRCAVELVAFSEEEGVRFRVPFVGSRALVGRVDDELLATVDADGVSVGEAIRGFGLDPGRMVEARFNRAARGYLEFHIEQGPVLESEDLSLGLVDTIAGQTRGEIVFMGTANHAGTTPMRLRRDAVAAMAEWIVEVEREARGKDGLVATVGRVVAVPGVGNVIAGEARASLDVRHANDTIRRSAVDALISKAEEIADGRGLGMAWSSSMEQRAVAMDASLTHMVENAASAAEVAVLRMMSGAGHDAMVVAERLPTAMIFLRSPGGISHHPDELVYEGDVAKALAVGMEFLKMFDQAKDTHA